MLLMLFTIGSKANAQGNDNGISIIHDSNTGEIGYVFPELAARHYVFLNKYCTQGERLYSIYRGQISILQLTLENRAQQIVALDKIVLESNAELNTLRQELRIISEQAGRIDRELTRERKKKKRMRTLSFAGLIATLTLIITR